MRSLFDYSRVVYRGGLEGAKRDVIDAAKTAGEAVGEAADKAILFAKDIKFWNTTKTAAKEAWDGFNRKFYPLENRPDDVEKTKRLITFVAMQIGVTERELKDALYIPLTQDSDPARKQKRHDILKKLVVMQGYFPEIELHFAGATHRLDRSNASGSELDGTNRDATWYMKKRAAMEDLMNSNYEIIPIDIRLFFDKHRDEVQEYISSSDPRTVAMKYPKLFLSGDFRDPLTKGRTLLDFAAAYEEAREYVRTLHNTPEVRNARVGIPSPRRFRLFVFEYGGTPQTRLHGVMMKHSGEEEVAGTGSGSGSTPSTSSTERSTERERAPDGKEGVRSNPIRDLNDFATNAHGKKFLRYPWKGVMIDREIDSGRYNLGNIAEYVSRIEKVLLKIDTGREYAEFWPLLDEMEIILTPNDVRDWNPFDEGNTSDGKLKIDYNESEESILHDIVDGLQRNNLREKPDVKSERLELEKQIELFLKNYDLLFSANEANKNGWRVMLRNAKNPQEFNRILRKDPLYAKKGLSEIRESARRAYHQKLYNYIQAWDAKIGNGKKDSGGLTKEQWIASNNSVYADSPEAHQARNIEWVIEMVRYFDANLAGIRNYPYPGVGASGGGESGKEKSPETGADRGRAQQALSAIARATGYPLAMLPTRVRDNIYTYDYDEITVNANAIQKAIKDLDSTETPERKAILKNIGLAPTPERTLKYKLRQEGLVKLADGAKRILFKVSESADEMAAAISKGIDEVQEDNSRSAKEAEKGKEKAPELAKDAIKAKIIAKAKDINAWYAISSEDREDDNFAGTGMPLEKIAKVFGVSGDPAVEDFAYRKLGNEIYGIVPSPDKPTDAPRLKVQKMLVRMSDKYGFNIRLQDGVEYDYGDILSSKAKFDAAFAAVKPFTKTVLAKAGVVLGEVSMSSDQEGVIKAPDGKYRIAIDWNEDASEITTQLDTYASEYEEEAKDLREDDVDDMSDAQVRSENDKKLKKIFDKYNVKFDYEDDFDDHKDLSGYIPEIERAFGGLTGADQEILKRGGYKIIISNGSSEEGLTDTAYTILIDYDDGVQAIIEDISKGIAEQEGKKNFIERGWDASTRWLKKKIYFWKWK